MPKPIAYNDEQIRVIINAAEPLAPSVRSRFLEAVSNDLRQHLPLTNAHVRSVCGLLQWKFLHPAEEQD
jgi:hypothetical protein